MTTDSFGNQLNWVVNQARGALFEQGELAQLTYGAFDAAATALQASNEDTITISYPVGYRADKQTMQGTRTYQKVELLGRYQFLAFQQLATNGIVQLVTIVETMLGDIVRAVVIKYPQKLGVKRTLPLQVVLQSTSIEEVHVRATDTLLNELSYKSPTEFADAFSGLLSINLLECPAFHKYIEVKASRDIFIHNRGIANEIYVRKAGSHVRVQAGMRVPADVQYFLESYEVALQLTEWLELGLHEMWHSSTFEDRKNTQLALPLPPARDDSE